MANASRVFEIETRRVARMFRLRYATFFIMCSAFTWIPFMLARADARPESGYVTASVNLAFGIALLIALLLPTKQAAALRYWLDGSTLRIDQGVVFLKRKSIPLDRITDVVMSQGPIMRLCGIWSLQIQTAGSNQQGPEGELYGIVDPEFVRDELMAARDCIVGAVNASGKD